MLLLSRVAKDWVDLPTVPKFVILHDNEQDSTVVEDEDGALMSEVVQVFLDSDELEDGEQVQLESLAKLYRARANECAVAAVKKADAQQSAKQWWRLW